MMVVVMTVDGGANEQCHRSEKDVKAAGCESRIAKSEILSDKPLLG